MKKVNKKIEELRIAAIATDDGGCGVYRIKIPYQNLQKRIKGIDVLGFNQSLNFDKLSTYDVIIFQRLIDGKVLQTMKRLKLAGKIVILECDDNLWNILPHNPSHSVYKPNSPYMKNFIESCKVADFIHVTTEYLKQIFIDKMGLNPNRIFAFNNSIDLSHPNYKRNFRDQLPEDKVVVMYQGGSSHHIDLEEIISPVRAIIENYPETMFAFCNHQSLFNKFGLNSDRAIMIPPKTKFDEFIGIPSFGCILLAPLNDKDTFNLGKSYLKILENGAFKKPSICSAVGDFNEYKKLNPSGTILTKNKFLDWYKNIERLVLDKELREKIGQSAFNDLANGSTSIEKVNNDRYFFYKSLLV